MPIYEYQCKNPDCGQEYESYTRGLEGTVCRQCGIGFLIRKYSFSTRPMFPEHFNPTIGRHVTSAADFYDTLKRQSDEATARTGIPHDYQPVDLRDAAAVGATDEGMDATRARRRTTGQDPATKRIIVL